MKLFISFASLIVAMTAPIVVTASLGTGPTPGLRHLSRGSPNDSEILLPQPQELQPAGDRAAAESRFAPRRRFVDGRYSSRRSLSAVRSGLRVPRLQVLRLRAMRKDLRRACGHRIRHCLRRGLHRDRRSRRRRAGGPYVSKSNCTVEQVNSYASSRQFPHRPTRLSLLILAAVADAVAAACIPQCEAVFSSVGGGTAHSVCQAAHLC
jgi:hypothetical protein